MRAEGVQCVGRTDRQAVPRGDRGRTGDRQRPAAVAALVRVPYATEATSRVGARQGRGTTVCATAPGPPCRTVNGSALPRAPYPHASTCCDPWSAAPWRHVGTRACDRASALDGRGPEGDDPRSDRGPRAWARGRCGARQARGAGARGRGHRSPRRGVGRVAGWRRGRLAGAARLTCGQATAPRGRCGGGGPAPRRSGWVRRCCGAVVRDMTRGASHARRDVRHCDVRDCDVRRETNGMESHGLKAAQLRRSFEAQAVGLCCRSRCRNARA